MDLECTQDAWYLQDFSYIWSCLYIGSFGVKVVTWCLFSKYEYVQRVIKQKTFKKLIYMIYILIKTITNIPFNQHSYQQKKTIGVYLYKYSTVSTFH